ncbi:MAG: hypothetical protein JJT89_04365 [Nitriliruptoraceae bacterium]|nr:hypothetical protein [Nitriliruptoraceae bacterium]
MIRRTPMTFGFLGLILAVVLVLDLVGPAPTPPEPAPTGAAGAPVAGTQVCGVGDTAADAALDLLVTRPGTQDDPPAAIEVDAIDDGSFDALDGGRIFAGAHRSIRPPADGATERAALTRWSDGPAVTWREWSLAAADGVPPATVAGGCAAPWSPVWYVPGLRTDGGNEARLRLTNPYRSAATVAIGFPTPSGTEEPLVLRNVTVPGRSVREIVVNETLPERTDLAAVVEVRSGRVSVEGVQLARSAIGDVAGASLLAAAPQAREEWTIPWLADDDERTSWLWVHNPSERAASVELTMHTPDGGVVPDGLAEVTIGPGEHARIELAGTLPEDLEAVALTARSNGVPIVLSGSTVLAPDDVDATGIAVQLGVEPDTEWVVAGVDAERRREQLQLVNPTSEPATVDVQLFDGAEIRTPAALQGLQIAPGALLEVPLDEALSGTDEWTASVRAETGAVVVGRVGERGDGAPGAPVGATDPDDAAADADAAPDEDAATDDDAPDPQDEDVEDDGNPTGAADDGVAIPDDDARRFIAVPGIPSAAWDTAPAQLRARSEGFLVDLRTPGAVGSAPVGTEGEPLPLDAPLEEDDDEQVDLDPTDPSDAPGEQPPLEDEADADDGAPSDGDAADEDDDGPASDADDGDGASDG